VAICIIPARGGSKRIPDKNIRPFLGKPVIVRAIDLAQQSGCFEKVVVSTDSAEVKRIAEGAGADVPFMRPDELSDDYASTISVIRHACGHFPSEEEICCLYPATPLIRSADLKKGAELLERADFVIPVTAYAHPVERALKLNQQGFLTMADSQSYAFRSQDLREYYHDVGAFYWGSKEAWLHFDNPFSGTVSHIRIPRSRAQDIDTFEDWEFAEFLYQFSQKTELGKKH
jgi:N-acylneuraminate cytidylyltransferase